MVTAVKKQLDSIKPEDLGQTPSDKHRQQCSICDHPEILSIEAQYLRGLPMTAVAEFYEIDRQVLGRHVAARELAPHRTRSTLTLIDAMIDSASMKDLKITAQNAAQILQTRAKLTGELIEKIEHQFSGNVEVRMAVADIRKNLIEQLGLGLAPGKIALPAVVRPYLEAHAEIHPEFDLNTIIFLEEQDEVADDTVDAALDQLRPLDADTADDDLEEDPDGDSGGDGYDQDGGAEEVDEDDMQ